MSATWTTGLTSASAAVLPNASAYFCVRGYPTNSTPLPASPSTAAEQNRSVVAARLGSASTQSFIPTYVGRVQRGNFIAASATTPTSTVSTFRIFPYSPLTPGTLYAPTVHLATAGLCYNISGGGNLSAPGASLIAFSCSSASVTPRNERFAQLPVPGTDSVQIRADSTDSTYGFLEANTAGTLVQSQVGDASNLRQRWIPQVLSNGTRQLINAATGYCLFGTGGSGSAFTTQPCNNLVGESSTWNTAGL
ncbi:RICIN domain-containing protein [Microbacterium sp. NPDC055665]